MVCRSFSCAVICLLLADTVVAAPNLIGQTGLINMPDGRIEQDGTLRLGVSHSDPYLSLWSSISLLPRLELSGRYTSIEGAPSGFVGYGDYKDKAFDGKFLLLKESNYLPSIAVGTQDFLGTQLFAANFVALSKRLHNFDISLGYGTERLNGWYGGLRYLPFGSTRWAWVAEYDVNDYRHDHMASLSGADKREAGISYGIEYRYGWLGTQVSYDDGQAGVNAYVSIPLMRKEFIPKIDEPKPLAKHLPQAASSEWRNDPLHAQSLIQLLNQQGFKNVQLKLRDGYVELSLTHPRISLISRAVGRAARTVLYAGPSDVHAIEIIYTENDIPLRSYRFTDLVLLSRYLNGEITLRELKPGIEVGYGPAKSQPATRDEEMNFEDVGIQHAVPVETHYGEDGHIVSIRREDYFSSGFRLLPINVRFFFNDPSGAYHYDTFSLLKFHKHAGRGLFFSASARLTLIEDVSDVTQPSNSLLPHVRSDIARYNREGNRLRMDTLLLNQYFHPRERLYGRFSAGYYEQMFAGAGGQLLYLPLRGNWAADLSVDALKQRKPGDNFGFAAYDTVTALGALHYRIPAYGITTTARAGRFLAEDAGVRLELKRRFKSGVEVGGWYTVTDGNDIMTPGSPDRPYHDKGIYLSVELNSMLTKDTRERASLSLAPWTRDVGQMVESPGDLYHMVERSLSSGSVDGIYSGLDN